MVEPAAWVPAQVNPAVVVVAQLEVDFVADDRLLVPAGQQLLELDRLDGADQSA